MNRTKKLLTVVLLVIITSAVSLQIIRHYKIFPYDYLVIARNAIYDVFLEKEFQETISRVDGAIFPPPSNGNAVAAYSFAVAGHSYGKPSGSNPALYPPFVDALSKATEKKELSFLVLAGDVMRIPSEGAYRTLRLQLGTLGKHFYIAPGNHDVETGKNGPRRNLFHSEIGETYRSFEHGDDLFISLDSNLTGWGQVKDQQLTFLKDVLRQKADQASNIFIFVHHLLWWKENDDVFGKINPNSGRQFSATMNYWIDVHPVLETLENEVFIFSGDVGAFPLRKSLLFEQQGNLNFIATGMGGGRRDNFIVVSVSNRGVRLKVLPF